VDIDLEAPLGKAILQSGSGRMHGASSQCFTVRHNA
jgi:hypothetical protein